MQAFHSMMQNASPPTVVPQMLWELLVTGRPDWTCISWRSKLRSLSTYRHFSIHYQSIRHRQEGIFEQGSTAHQSQPNSEEVLILFVTELSQTLVVYNSVRTYLAGVRHFHVVNSAGNSLQDKLRLQLALAGIRRVET